MSFQLGDLLNFGSGWWLTIVSTFFRTGAAMAVLPVVGERSIPVRVRLVITLVYTFVVSTAIYSNISITSPTTTETVFRLAQEIAVGLALGFGLRAMVFAIQMAGSMAAQSTSLSQVFGGAAVEPQPAIGHLLLAAGMALAVTYGLHVRIAEFLVFSYEILPADQVLHGADMSTWGVAQISKAFSLAFSLAAPFVLASLIYNIALGAINKAMPQLMVSFVGAPAVTAGGLLLLFVCAPIMLSVWQSALNTFFISPFVIPR